MDYPYICQTCGVQQAPTAAPPASCPICADERQYIGHSGQHWLTYPELKSTHRNVIKLEEPGLYGIGVEPKFAIGQRALLLQTESGNILWDCVPLLDETTFATIQAMGGLKAIALSHPHFNSAIVEWSQAFGGIPVYIHEADRQWALRPDPAIQFWSGQTLELAPGVTVINCGGHFPGSSVLHWAQGAGGQGILLTGDTIYVVADRRYVTFMYSFPNLVPLQAAAVQQIVDRVAPYQFERIYSAWFGAVVPQAGNEVVRRSAERYLRQIGG
ncbi:MAG: MBL fold metallo-hydrolase [Ardenticatenales bacterium]|nr:MBL fold metallo-hydrolase [Ardenticatenales bacterium]